MSCIYISAAWSASSRPRDEGDAVFSLVSSLISPARGLRWIYTLELSLFGDIVELGGDLLFLWFLLLSGLISRWLDNLEELSALLLAIFILFTNEFLSPPMFRPCRPITDPIRPILLLANPSTYSLPELITLEAYARRLPSSGDLLIFRPGPGLVS